MMGLAEYCGGLTAKGLEAPVATLLESTIRCCLFCVALGTRDEKEAVAGLWVSRRPGASTNITDAIAQAVYQSTLGAAVDLDPMSIGPAHLALPATVAALVAAELLGKQSDQAVAGAVLAGIEAGGRIRAALIVDESAT